MGDVFYIVGIGLTLMALGLSFAGLRTEKFPPSRAASVAILGVMGSLVIATCAFAVILAREEQQHREEEQAREAKEAAAEEPAAAAEEPGPVPAPADEDVEKEPAPADAVAVSSPEDGSLLFEPDALDAAAGPVEIAYTNPSAVPHNVAIEADGETLAESATVTDGDSASANAELEPGEYVFYCAIPGHRESGMEGTLRIK